MAHFTVVTSIWKLWAVVWAITHKTSWFTQCHCLSKFNLSGGWFSSPDWSTTPQQATGFLRYFYEIIHRARLELLDAAQNIMQGQSEYEDQLRELRELLYRNPSFPGDLVGWLDDDFDLPDDEDDNR